MIAPCLASFLINRFIPENKSQFKLIKDHNSTRMKIFLINTSVPGTLYSNMLTFRGSNKTFKLDGDLLETITNSDFIVNHANTQGQKQIFQFGKEMKIVIRQKGRKSNRDRSLISLLKPPTVMASEISTIFLPKKAIELCDKLKLLLQDKPARTFSVIIDEEIVAIFDELLEYKCISKKQHRQLLNQCNLSHK